MACTATNREFGCSRIGCCYWERRGFGVSPSRARWFLEFFSSWEVPVAFLCISFVLGGLCFWISTRADGIYEGLGIAGVAVSAMTSVVLIVLAVLAGLVWLIVYVLEDEKIGRRFNSKQGSGSRKQKHGRRK